MTITPISAISAQIAFSKMESKELNEKKEVNQQQSQLLAYQLISEISAVNTRLEILKLQLISSNALLKKEIVQLKIQHRYEVDSLVNGVKLKVALVSTEVQAIVEELNVCMITDFAKANSISEKDVALIKTCSADISKIFNKEIFNYPEYFDVRDNSLTNNQKQDIIFPKTASQSIKTDLVLKAFIEKAHQTYETLKLENAPLEYKSQSLINEKEMMVDFHQKYLEKFKKEELNLPLKELYDLISSLYKQVEWEKLFTLRPVIYASIYNPERRALYIKGHQEILDLKANKMKEKTKLIISDLEPIINPEIIIKELKL